MLRNKILEKEFKHREINFFMEKFVDDYLLGYQIQREFYPVDIKIKYLDDVSDKNNLNFNHIFDRICNQDSQYREIWVNFIFINQFKTLPKESNIALHCYSLIHELIHSRRRNPYTISPFSEILCEAITESLTLKIYEYLIESAEKIKIKDIRNAMIATKKLKQKYGNANSSDLYISSINGIYKICSHYTKEVNLLKAMEELIAKKLNTKKEDVEKTFAKAYILNDNVVIDSLFVNAFEDLAIYLFPWFKSSSLFEDLKSSLSLLKTKLNKN